MTTQSKPTVLEREAHRLLVWLWSYQDRHGLSRGQLARQVGVDDTQVQRWEKGALPRRRNCKRIQTLQQRVTKTAKLWAEPSPLRPEVAPPRWPNTPPPPAAAPSVVVPPITRTAVRVESVQFTNGVTVTASDDMVEIRLPHGTRAG